jgi:hypothetical protein
MVYLRYLLLFGATSTSIGFLLPTRPPNSVSTGPLFSAGKGFDPKKTYDAKALKPRNDVIDTESAMREFFEGSAGPWKPLFRSMTRLDNVWLDQVDTTNFKFHETTSPWQRLPAIPTDDGHRQVLAEFLDHVQASLIEIPVDETTKEDDLDLHFLEEGRRMLVCGRFHVIPYGSTSSRMDHGETLFATCWNEIFHLYDQNQENTGSLLVVPGSNIDDLRRFVDMQLQRPLQWLGLEETFEVTSLLRGSPAIRLIHKLSAIPTDLPDQAETM